MAKDEYRKHFIPLESNPEVFTKLLHELGVSDTFSFVDIWALDCIEHVPRPAAALVLVLPTSTEYEQRQFVEDAGRKEDNETRGDGVIWLPQTINNACGLYAILHAACNGDTRLSIRRPIPHSRPCNILSSKTNIYKARDLS
jgi:ubiquitin carboxyl-terminal hydrolase L3